MCLLNEGMNRRAGGPRAVKRPGQNLPRPKGEPGDRKSRVESKCPFIFLRFFFFFWIWTILKFYF